MTNVAKLDKIQGNLFQTAVHYQVYWKFRLCPSSGTTVILSVIYQRQNHLNSSRTNYLIVKEIVEAN
jgi:hypothetical protein